MEEVKVKVVLDRTDNTLMIRCGDVKIYYWQKVAGLERTESHLRIKGMERRKGKTVQVGNIFGEVDIAEEWYE